MENSDYEVRERFLAGEREDSFEQSIKYFYIEGGRFLSRNMDGRGEIPCWERMKDHILLSIHEYYEVWILPKKT